MVKKTYFSKPVIFGPFFWSQNWGLKMTPFWNRVKKTGKNFYPLQKGAWFIYKKSAFFKNGTKGCLVYLQKKDPKKNRPLHRDPPFTLNWSQNGVQRVPGLSTKKGPKLDFADFGSDFGVQKWVLFDPPFLNPKNHQKWLFLLNITKIVKNSQKTSFLLLFDLKWLKIAKIPLKTLKSAILTLFSI